MQRPITLIIPASFVIQMIYVLLILVFSISFSSCVVAPNLTGPKSLELGAFNQVRGQDYLAAQLKGNFHVNQATPYLQDNQAIGSLDITFGTSLDPIRKLLATKPKYYRVHIINGSCIRNGVCQTFEIGYGYSKNSFDLAVRNKNQGILGPFKKRVGLYKGLAEEFPDTIFVLSPELEHDLSLQSYRVLANAVLNIWPDVQLDNSPDGGVPVEKYKGAWIERHGSNPQADADIISMDGAEGTDLNIPKYLKNNTKAKILFFWTRMYNCRTNSTVWQAPRNRVACPTAGHFEEFAHIFDVRPPAPNFMGGNCPTIKPFDYPWLLKPLAESGLPYGGRMDWPLVILPLKDTNAVFLAANGSKLGNFAYYDTYDPLHGFRYYSKYGDGSVIQGYELEKRARAETSNPNTWVKVQNICYGPLIAGRRAGSYK